VKRARKILAGPEPDLAPGDHCSAPYPCEFAGWCNRDLPDGPDWPGHHPAQGRGHKVAGTGYRGAALLMSKICLNNRRGSLLQHAVVMPITMSGALARRWPMGLAPCLA
jgi:hypothetical protein